MRTARPGRLQDKVALITGATVALVEEAGDEALAAVGVTAE